ncbi:MAG: hypothetical protein OJF47_004218 [Nitrospira sp.]|jgi:hypothetical protein|nr:MAG: hypothetical protein OJF47_004218 [Nitrospira sp.]
MRTEQAFRSVGRSNLMTRVIVVLVLASSASGCAPFFTPMRTPIGHSSDENGRRCSTYQTRSAGVYETRCDNGGPAQAS